MGAMKIGFEKRFNLEIIGIKKCPQMKKKGK